MARILSGAGVMFGGFRERPTAAGGGAGYGPAVWRAGGGTGPGSLCRYFFFLGFLVSFLGLRSFATKILPSVGIIRCESAASPWGLPVRRAARPQRAHRPRASL